jgi:hypothetical protein
MLPGQQRGSSGGGSGPGEAVATAAAASSSPPRYHSPHRGGLLADGDGAGGGGGGAAPQLRYEVAVATSDVPDAGTDGGVWVLLEGTRGRSGWVRLESGVANVRGARGDGGSSPPPGRVAGLSCRISVVWRHPARPTPHLFGPTPHPFTPTKPATRRRSLIAAAGTSSRWRPPTWAPSRGWWCAKRTLAALRARAMVAPPRATGTWPLSRSCTPVGTRGGAGRRVVGTQSGATAETVATGSRRGAARFLGRRPLRPAVLAHIPDRRQRPRPLVLCRAAEALRLPGQPVA